MTRESVRVLDVHAFMSPPWVERERCVFRAWLMSVGFKDSMVTAVRVIDDRAVEVDWLTDTFESMTTRVEAPCMPPWVGRFRVE